MTLRITVLPASTQAGTYTIRALLNDKRKPSVKALYRNPAKAPAEFTSNPNFKAIKGDVSADSELDLSDSDAVFYVPPPTYDGTDSAEFAERAANNVKASLKKVTELKRLVVFSATGAQHEKDIGLLLINHIADKILKNSAPEVVIAKTGFFMENWISAFETIKADTAYFESYFSPPDYKFTMVSLEDIGQISAKKLLEAGQPLSTNPYVFDLQGPRDYSSNDVKDALETATGKKINLKCIEPDQLLPYFSEKVPAPYDKQLTEMILAMIPGGLIAAEMGKQEVVERGPIELVDIMRKLASGETQKAPSGAF